MDFSIAALVQHGYWIVAAVVFLESVGIPIPAALIMLLAGSACAQGSLHGGYVLGVAILSMVSGDILMYLMGRYTGWWLLGCSAAFPFTRKLASFDPPILFTGADGSFCSSRNSCLELIPWLRRSRAACACASPSF